MITATLKKSLLFLVPYGIVAACCLTILACFGTAEVHLWINRHHCSGCDWFFRYYTHIGAGLTVVIISCILLFHNYGQAAYVFSSYLLSGIIVQVIKRLLFPGVMRPVSYFSGKAELYIVPGTSPNLMQSFPSGHTATAFAFFLSISLLTRNKWLQWPFLICAVAAGYSRMYLSEHFLRDVLAGSLIGIFCALLLHVLYRSGNRSWMDKHLAF